MITFIGTTFPATAEWHNDEVSTIDCIHKQIDKRFPNETNLYINTTWFGPQFNNGQWDNYRKLIDNGIVFDNVFLLAAADPIFLNDNQVNTIKNE